LEMWAEGNAGLDGQLDLMVVYRFLSTLKNIPILGQVGRGISFLGSTFFKIHIGGTIENPQVKPVPLSLDKLKVLRFKAIEPQPPAAEETASPGGDVRPPSPGLPSSRDTLTTPSGPPLSDERKP
ncbi:MAG TPA: hypothetical protein VM492_13965, partial [Sumerlaeia bacterium]|nr:hypothetical protein [Sumerlaeia bacterium]